MPITPAQIAADFLLGDNLEMVTLRRRAVGDAWTDVTSVPALRFQASRDLPSVSPGQAAHTKTAFHLHAPTCGSIPPLPKDRLVDETSVTWVIDEVQEKTWRTRYHCECHRMPVTGG